MPTPTLHINTRLIHGGYSPESETGATITPIFQNSAFAYKTAEQIEDVFAGREGGYIYTRINNPTIDSFERRLNAAESGLAALACSSGMAAISTALMGLAGSGDEIVSGNSLFGGTYSLLAHTLERFGIHTKFVESTDLAAFKAAITDRTKAIFVESIGNPKLDVPDIKALSALAKENGIALVVDSTVTTPVLFPSKSLGVDIVVHSTSKFINGHGTAIGGAMVDCGTGPWSGPRYVHLHDLFKQTRQFAFLAFLRTRLHRDLGPCLAPQNAFLMSTGMDTLGLRMERHSTNALALATFLSKHPTVAETRYPGLASHPNHAVAARQFTGGFGAILTIRLGDRERCFKFINGLRRVQNLANLGDVKTLAIHPASTICRECTDEERKAIGVTDDLIRMCVGLEHIDDIQTDMDSALKAL